MKTFKNMTFLIVQFMKKFHFKVDLFFGIPKILIVMMFILGFFALNSEAKASHKHKKHYAHKAPSQSHQHHAKAKKGLAHPRQTFESWLISFKKEAMKKGFAKKFVDEAFEGVQYNPIIISRDRKQYPTKEVGFDEFLDQFMKIDDPDYKTRYEKGEYLLKKNKDLFDQIEKKFHVNRDALTSLWAIESLFGSYIGIYPVIQSLATLSYDGRRKKFFKKELISSLKILKEGHVTKEKFLGSWAGAIGQCQFMPSNFFVYAYDFDGDKKKDIWYNEKDALASMANYLHKVRWKEGVPVGFLVKVPEKFSRKNYSKRVKKSLEEWKKLGVVEWGDQKFPELKNKKLKAKLIRAKFGVPAILAFDNYDTILRWNRSNLFTAKVIAMMDKFRDSKID